MSNVKDTMSGAAAALPRMGGIALRNGLILMSEKHWAAAIRDAAGLISVASGLKPKLPVGAAPGSEGEEAAGIPVLRGLGRFGETLMVLAQAKMNLPGAQLPIEGGRVAAALGASVGAGSLIKTLAPKSALVQEVGGALAAFIPAVVALKNSPISGYHGAEHKVIGGREALLRAESVKSVAAAAGAAAAALQGSRATGGRDASAAFTAAPKEHDRCGSNLVGPFFLATVVTSLLARGRSGRKSPAASAVAAAASLGLALEALRWGTKHQDHPLAKAMFYPGRLLQERFTTTEPTPEQLEVGERAMDELLRLEEEA